ncbi:MAG: zinc ribbon domain-containing protein [Blautia sp.]
MHTNNSPLGVYRCACGNEMDRDRNAAINIREEARRMLTA